VSLETRSLRLSERFWELLVRAAGLSAIVAIGLICVFLFRETATFHFGSEESYPLTEFLTGTGWYPISDPERFGLLPLLLGSLTVTAGAMLIAVPLGIGAATYLGEFAPRLLREILKPMVELLAAIPSVVIGVFGMIVLGPLLVDWFGLRTGLTAFTGSIALAIMALPTIISIADDALNAVPDTYRASSLALGANKWQTTWRVVLPAAAPGVLAAVILGMGRVIGETMAVLMVTGNAAVMPTTPFAPVRTMTATIAAEMGETVQGSLHFRALFAIGAVLFLISFVINAIASWALNRSRKIREGRA
jgi:phosphate transport system permease protein